MKIQHLFIITIVITLIISLGCISLFPSIQDFMSYNTTWNGIRNSLTELNANTIDSIQNINQPDSKKILISIPYIQYNDVELQDLKTFLNNGGTLMLMDDFGYGNSVLEYLNLDCRFSGAPLLDPLFCYKNQWLPRVTDFNSALVSADVHDIVLNHATALLNTGDMVIIAKSSPDSFLDINGNESLDYGEPAGPLPVAAKVKLGSGTIILISDPSILINSMLTSGDNLLFLKNILEPRMTDEPVLLDTSHLVNDPLELTKNKLATMEDDLSRPWALLVIIVLVFTGTSIYVMRNGGPLGRKS